MKENLDKWIKDAREITPDSGEYRRLNRILVKERMLVAGPRGKRHHRVLILSLTVLILFLFSGQLSQLGGDSFETVKKIEVGPLGDPQTIYYDVFGPGSVNLPDDYTASDVAAFKHALAAGEGEMIEVLGLSYGGKSSWIKIMRRDINGRELIDGLSTTDPASEDLPDELEFLLAHMEGLVARTKNLPAHHEFTMDVEGIPVAFKSWTFEYPGYGPVTRSAGVPITKK